MGKKNDDISFNISGTVKSLEKFLKKTNTSLLIAGVLVLALLIMVFSIRMLPAELPVTDQWAEQSILSSVRQQAAQQIQQQYPALPPENLEQRVNQEVATMLSVNEQQFELAKSEFSEQLKTRLRYTGEDGKEYTYLGDLDSYFWLRYTRNILETGTTCDTFVDGQCYETYTPAPVGSPVPEWRGLHPVAIGWLHNIITIFNKEYPLPQTSFMLSALLGTLLVIPAFFIGRRLAGNTAGVFAAILVAVQPLVLSRSIGSDNDIWNVLMPLVMLWLLVEALQAKDRKLQITFSILAGLAVAIHATVWVAWWFTYLIALLGLLGAIAYRKIEYFIREKKFTAWKDANVMKTATVLIAFYLTCLVFVPLLPTDVTVSMYLTQPKAMLSSSAGLDQAIGNSYWPNVLTTVAELNEASFNQAVAQMGGKLFFLVSIIGLLLLMMPRAFKKWKWEQWGILVVGIVLGGYLVQNSGLGKFTVLILLILPLAVLLLLNLLRHYKVDIDVALILLVWFLATIFAAYSGVRFILLMAPAFAVAFGITAGRVYEWGAGMLQSEIKWHPWILNILVFAVLCLVLIAPVKAGMSTAGGFVPSIDDGWWQSLEKIKQESHPDAIINSWWDFGHWFKYVADRRVSADGTTQNTHIPHWLGKALVTSDEREAVGILRMLDCGSDAFPSELGWEGAYGKTLSYVEDPIIAHDIVSHIVTLDKEEATEYLRERGFSEEEYSNILSSSHCEPPENYFITSGDMVGKSGVWAHFGLWDFRRAYVAQEARYLSPDEAIRTLTEKFGWTEEEAESLYFEAKGLGSDERAINTFVSPWPGYITANWIGGCQGRGNGTGVECPINLQIGQRGAQVNVIESALYNRTSPRNSTLTVAAYQNGRRVAGERGTPSMFVIAGEETLEVIEFEESVSNIAVIIDTQRNRVLLSDPLLATSMFTQLFYLEGRYNEYFKEFDDRSTYSNSRILVWQVDWDGAAQE